LYRRPIVRFFSECRICGSTRAFVHVRLVCKLRIAKDLTVYDQARTIRSNDAEFAAGSQLRAADAAESLPED